METYELPTRFGLAPHVGLVDGNHALIAVPRPELYDVDADPDEKHDLSSADVALVTKLRAELDAFGFKPPVAGAGVDDPEVAGQLAAMGYTSGSFVGPLTGALPDPKDSFDLLEKSDKAQELARNGKVLEAEKMLAALRTAHPDVIEFASRDATMLDRLGRPEDAVLVVKGALARAPERTSLMQELAGLFIGMKQYDQAAELYQQVVDKAPLAQHVRGNAVRALFLAGKADQGMALGAEYLATSADDPEVAGLVGAEYARRNDAAHALPLLQIGIKATHPEPDVCYAMASFARDRKEWPAAEKLLEQELLAYPRNFKAGHALLVVETELQGWATQERLAQALIDHEGPTAELYRTKAQAQFNQKDYANARKTLNEALKLAPKGADNMLLDANLIAKEGDLVKAKARFEEAKAAKEKEVAAEEAAAAATVPPSAP